MPAVRAHREDGLVGRGRGRADRPPAERRQVQVEQHLGRGEGGGLHPRARAGRRRPRTPVPRAARARPGAGAPAACGHRRPRSARVAGRLDLGGQPDVPQRVGAPRAVRSRRAGTRGPSRRCRSAARRGPGSPAAQRNAVTDDFEEPLAHQPAAQHEPALLVEVQVGGAAACRRRGRTDSGSRCRARRARGRRAAPGAGRRRAQHAGVAGATAQPGGVGQVAGARSGRAARRAARGCGG